MQYFAFFYCTGKEVGVIVTTPLAGILCASTFLGGWPAAFYVFGMKKKPLAKMKKKSE